MVREFPRIIEKPQAGFTGRPYNDTLPLNLIWRAYTERAGCASRCRLTSAFRHSQRRSRSVQPLKKQICPADFIRYEFIRYTFLPSFLPDGCRIFSTQALDRGVAPCFEPKLLTTAAVATR